MKWRRRHIMKIDEGEEETYHEDRGRREGDIS